MMDKLIPFALFFIVANPKMFMLTQRFFGPVVADDTGRPTQVGVLLHALVYVLLCSLIWHLAY
jgi:hypothetical protein